MYNSISNPAYKICLDKDTEARFAETAGITDVLLHLPMNLHRYGYHSVYYILISARGTPLEVLHTLLLGPYKYLLRATMAKLSKNNTLSCLLFCLHFHHLASPVESLETLQSITSLLLVGILRHWHRWLSLSFHHSWLLLRLKCG